MVLAAALPALLALLPPSSVFQSAPASFPHTLDENPCTTPPACALLAQTVHNSSHTSVPTPTSPAGAAGPRGNGPRLLDGAAVPQTILQAMPPALVPWAPVRKELVADPPHFLYASLRLTPSASRMRSLSLLAFGLPGALCTVGATCDAKAYCDLVVVLVLHHLEHHLPLDLEAIQLVAQSRLTFHALILEPFFSYLCVSHFSAFYQQSCCGAKASS